jgi:hypothetical protein
MIKNTHKNTPQVTNLLLLLPLIHTLFLKIFFLSPTTQSLVSGFLKLIFFISIIFVILLIIIASIIYIWVIRRFSIQVNRRLPEVANHHNLLNQDFEALVSIFIFLFFSSTRHIIIACNFILHICKPLILIDLVSSFFLYLLVL